jgi:hypothetical protein
MPGDLGGCSSFRATGPLATALGLLSVTALIAGPERAVLDASLRPPAEPALFGPAWRETVIARNRDYLKAIAFEDVSVTDDRGASYVLRTREKAGFPSACSGRPVKPLISCWSSSPCRHPGEPGSS